MQTVVLHKVLHCEEVSLSGLSATATAATAGICTGARPTSLRSCNTRINAIGLSNGISACTTASNFGKHSCSLVALTLIHRKVRLILFPRGWLVAGTFHAGRGPNTDQQHKFA